MVKKLVEEWTVDEDNKNRKIYHNINGLKIDGLHTAPDDFRECDDGAIIIYDEAQDIEYYSSDSRSNPVAKELSKHRHRGFDIHFITQDPALLNKWVLKNVYLHYYLWRPAQSKNIEVYTFARAIVSPTKQDFKSAYDKKLWRFEPHYLQYYKSTVLNTSKKLGSSKRTSILVTGFLFACIIAYFIRPLFSLNKMPEQGEEQPSEQVTQKEPTNSPISANRPPTQAKQDQLQELEYLQRQVQIEQLKRQLELYTQNLPKDYQVTKQDPNLQVRAVISSQKACKAYNAHGDLMTLSDTDCQYYIKEPGRVHKANTPQQTYKYQPSPTPNNAQISSS